MVSVLYKKLNASLAKSDQPKLLIGLVKHMPSKDKQLCVAFSKAFTIQQSDKLLRVVTLR